MHRKDYDLNESARQFFSAFEDAVVLRKDIAESREGIIRLELAYAALKELQNIVSQNSLDDAVKNTGNIRLKEGRGHIGLVQADQYFRADGSFRDSEDNPYKLINEGRYTDEALKRAHGIEGVHSTRERVIMDALEFDIGARLMGGECAKYLTLDITDENIEQQQQAISARKDLVFNQIGAVFNRVGSGLQMSDPSSPGFSKQFQQVLDAELKGVQMELDQHQQTFSLAEKGAVQVEQNLQDKQQVFFEAVSQEAKRCISASDYKIANADKEQLQAILSTPGEGIMPFFRALLKEFADNGFIVAEGENLITNTKLIGSLNDQQPGGDYLRLLAGLIKFSYSNISERGSVGNQASAHPPLDDAEKLIVRSACMVNTTETNTKTAELLSAFRASSPIDKIFDELPSTVRRKADGRQQMQKKSEKVKEKIASVKGALFNRGGIRSGQSQDTVRRATPGKQRSKGR